MSTCHRITFVESDAPIVGPVTKFGGRPTWLEAPAWPLSRSTGNPMRFIGQVALGPSIFGAIPARMAYLFMTDEEEYVDGTWEPDSGENAVILQPGTYDGPTAPLEAGPSAYRMVEEPGATRLTPEACEFAAILAEVADTPLDPDAEDIGDFPNQITGTPNFLQNEEYPAGGPWRLLLQLDSATVPFYVNFGDAGIGYAFLSEDGTAAKFLWQCA